MSVQQLVSLTVVALTLVVSGCITLYPEYPIDRPYTETSRVLTPAPESITEYSPATAESWNNTFNECIQIREWLAFEIARRRTAAATKRSLFTIMGAVASFVGVLYSAVEDSPDETVLVPLGLVSGTSMVTLHTAVVNDERLDSLVQRLTVLDEMHGHALDSLFALEQHLTELYTVEEELEVADASIAGPLRTKYEELRAKNELLVGSFQRTLKNWQLMCQ